MTASEFFESSTLQLVTLIIAVSMFVSIPIIQRKVAIMIDAKHRKQYEALAKDAYVKTLIMFIGVVVTAALSIGMRPITQAVTQSMFFICFASAFGAGWTIYKAHNDLKSIKDDLKSSGNSALLEKINLTNLKAYTYGLLSALIGLFGLALVNYTPINEQPSWLWFAAFLLTSFAIAAQRWSDSVTYVVNGQRNLTCASSGRAKGARR